MSSEELERIVSEYIGELDYVFYNHQEVFDLVSEKIDGITEEDVRKAIESCEFKVPDKIALICFFLPILETEISDRVLGVIFGTIYKIFTWIYIIVAWSNIILNRSLEFFILALFVFNFILYSALFRTWTQQWNSLELIDKIIQEKYRD